jgi:hypothetical protein
MYGVPAIVNVPLRNAPVAFAVVCSEITADPVPVIVVGPVAPFSSSQG